MEVEKIFEGISKPATVFQTGGFRPENRIEENWIGKVSVYGINEGIPLDQGGTLMIPLAQFYIPSFPFIPKAISDTKIISVFISENMPKCFDKMGDNWLIREYQELNKVTFESKLNIKPFVKPFPLRPALVKRDFPIWDGGGLTDEQEDQIMKLEGKGLIKSYDDVMTHSYKHKFGGYPSYCQPGIGINDGFGDNFEYVFQISSDSKADLNIVDNGSLMFATNSLTGEWSLYYDFY